MKTTINWKEIVSQVNYLREKLDAKPDSEKALFNRLSVGSIVNDYREGDATFNEVVSLLQIKLKTHKYDLQQEVYYEVKAEVHSVKISSWEKFIITGVQMTSDSEKICFTYHLSIDPPAPFYSGKGVQFANIDEKLLRET